LRKKLENNNTDWIDISTNYLPIMIDNRSIEQTFKRACEIGNLCPVLAVVTGTKPDFYKQAPLVTEALRQNLPALVIDTGQHYDDTLSYGVTEFGIQDSIGCTLQIRGNLMEKASELLLKFAKFGKICKDRFPENPILPIVHGDTLVAAISPLSWLFGTGQKVAQNEAGLRSMSPEALKSIGLKAPDKYDIENFLQLQFDENKWFISREEPFPEQVDTWICSAGTQFFFAPSTLNKRNLVREGYPEENIYVVGNSVVDAIDIKRKTKPEKSIFEIYPRLSSSSSSTSSSYSSAVSNNSNTRDQWIRVDIHRRENLTRTRFFAIIEALIRLVKMGYKTVLVKLTATQHALTKYGLIEKLDKLEDEFPHNFIQTGLWKEYGHVIEFLDSGECWLELTDSGSMQEELLYFPNVNSITVRLNTDRPETIFEAYGNVLAPPINPEWIVEIVRLADQDKIPFLHKKKREIYGRPGQVSQKIIRILKKHFEEDYNFYPWLHQRLGLWKETDNDFSFL
jgi:UDP-N-acetylglucosamine 2-epimerase